MAQQEMHLQQAAEKWGLSVNWVRQLVKSGRVNARLATEGPIPYYAIPIDEPKPESQRLTPLPKGTVLDPVAAKAAAAAKAAKLEAKAAAKAAKAKLKAKLAKAKPTTWKPAKAQKAPAKKGKKA